MYVNKYNCLFSAYRKYRGYYCIMIFFSYRIDILIFQYRPALASVLATVALFLHVNLDKVTRVKITNGIKKPNCSTSSFNDSITVNIRNISKDVPTTYGNIGT